MSLLEAIVLGIVQGLTEFLPISSTGHLRIVPAFLGWEDPGAAFTAVTQLGTMAAVLLYFRDDLWRIARAWLESIRDRPKRRELDARLGWYIVLGTVPIGVFGVLFKDQIETGARDLYVIGVALIVVGRDHVDRRPRRAAASARSSRSRRRTASGCRRRSGPRPARPSRCVARPFSASSFRPSSNGHPDPVDRGAAVGEHRVLRERRERLGVLERAVEVLARRA